MNTYIPIKHLEVVPSLEQIFLIEGSEQRFGINKKPFVILKFKDLTGKIKCFIFGQELNDALGIGKFISVTCKVELRDEEMQLVAQSWQPFNGHPDNLSDYIHCPNPNVLKVYAERLQSYIDSIEDSDYRNMIGNLTSDRMRLFKKLEDHPFELSGKWSYRGGLLIYTVLLIGLINKILEGFQDGQHSLNKDTLILGTIFRNLGWWPCTIQKGDLFVPSEIHDQLGIRFVSGMLANHSGLTTESDLKIQLPLSKKLALQHIATATPNSNITLSAEADLILKAEEILKKMDFNI